MEEAKLGTMTKRKIGYGIVQPGDTLVDGIPVIKVNNIISGLRNVSDLDKTSIENDRKYHRTKLIGGELLISVVGTIGKTAIVPHAFAGCNLVRAVVMIDIPDTLLSLWVKYYIDSPKGQSYIKQNLNTTVQPTLNVKSLVEMPIPLFPKKTMETIVGELKTLDDKIEVNRRINDNFTLLFLLLTYFVLWLLKLRNDNLQQQAQALFDKMFPQITKGDSTVGNMITPQRGKGLLSKNAISGEVPVVAGGIEPATFHNVSNTTPPVLTIAASGANAGYINLWHIPVWSSDSSFIDSKMTSNVYFWYVMLKKRQKEIFDAQVGSAQPHIYPKHIAELPMQEVEENRLLDYNRIVTPVFKQIGKNVAENNRLASIRDVLLPKLMSGDLKIS